MSIKQWLRVNKEGIVLGALGGFLFTVYLNATGADLSFALQTQSILDPIVGYGQSAKELALTKVGLTYIIIGGIIGGIIDSLYKPKI